VIDRWPSTTHRGGYAIHPSFDLEQTYDRYAKLLFSIAYSVLDDRADAEDCVHDTVLRMWKNPRAYDAARGALKSLLVVAVRNASISLLRKRTRHKQIEQTLAPDQGAQEFEIPDYLERSVLRDALRMLPPEQWDVVRLGYFEYLTHLEIAQRLGVPLGTVKSRITLAIRRLASAMPARENTR